METRKSTTLGASALNIRFNQAVNYDNSSDIDAFWNSLVDCVQAAYPADKVSISTDNIAVKIADYAQFGFVKDDQGIKVVFDMPFMLPTPDEPVLRGYQKPLIMPIVSVNDTFDKVSFELKPDLKSSPSGDLANFLAFVTYALTNLRVSYDEGSSALTVQIDGIEIDRDEIESFASAQGLSLSLPDQASYFKVYGSITIPVLSENLQGLRATWHNSVKVSFYDSGVVLEPYKEFTIPVSSITIDPNRVSVSLKIETYDTEDNLLGTGKVLVGPASSLKPLTFQFGLSQRAKFLKAFTLLKSIEPVETIVVTRKVSTTAPQYELESAPSLLESGRYVVVFNKQQYAYRVVTEINDNVVTFDQELPFPIEDGVKVWLSTQPPLVVAFDAGVSYKSQDYLKSVRLDLGYVKYTKFLDTADADYSRYNMPEFYAYIGIFGADYPSASVIVSSNTGQSVGDVLTPIYIAAVSPFEKRVNLPLPKFPVSDGELSEDFLEEITLLSPEKVISKNNLMKIFGIPALFSQTTEEGNLDFYGFAPMFLVYSPKILTLFPSKAFLNKNEFRVLDSEAFVLSFVESSEEQKYALFKIESSFKANKNFVARV